MKKELEYFKIDGDYGFNQDKFKDPLMKMGGCAAVTACDVCIYLDKYRGTNLYPFDESNINYGDYIEFSKIMKPYLHPRIAGINKLSIYTDGLGKYIESRGGSITLKGFEGYEKFTDAAKIIKEQIDKEIPVPFLTLYHGDRQFKDYEWHWYIINGYELYGDTLMVKAVTYGEWSWLDFSALWDTKRKSKGGFIIINTN